MNCFLKSYQLLFLKAFLVPFLHFQIKSFFIYILSIFAPFCVINRIIRVFILSIGMEVDIVAFVLLRLQLQNRPVSILMQMVLFC